MLTAVKNQLKINLLSIKYSLMREMLNKTTFITNVVFMILNNASFIIQWLIIYSIKDDVGGYSFKQVLLLWGFASGIYGFSRFFFKNAFKLSNTINNGKLDSFLVQPKNVLLQVITTDVESSAIGDLIYGYIMLFVYGVTLSNFILYTLCTICGGIILAGIAVILGSLSFWFNKSDMLADTGNNIMVNFATYPEGIFKGLVKIILFTIVPVGVVYYLPVEIISSFNIYLVFIVLLVTSLICGLAFTIFYKGLKRYSPSNLMIARI